MSRVVYNCGGCGCEFEPNSSSRFGGNHLCDSCSSSASDRADRAVERYQEEYPGRDDREAVDAVLESSGYRTEARVECGYNGCTTEVTDGRSMCRSCERDYERQREREEREAEDEERRRQRLLDSF